MKKILLVTLVIFSGLSAITFNEVIGATGSTKKRPPVVVLASWNTTAGTDQTY